MANQVMIDPAKQFAQDLRRVLYVSAMLKDYMEWLKIGKSTPPFIKNSLNSINNAINRLLLDIRTTASPEMWEAIKSDLTGDQIKDLALLIDVCHDVVNIDSITDIIRESKFVCNPVT